MPTLLMNLKKNFSIAEDNEGSPYAFDHEKYPNFLNDSPETEYEIHPVTKKGEVVYESVIKMSRHQLNPKFIGQG